MTSVGLRVRWSMCLEDHPFCHQTQFMLIRAGEGQCPSRPSAIGSNQLARGHFSRMLGHDHAGKSWIGCHCVPVPAPLDFCFMLLIWRASQASPVWLLSQSMILVKSKVHNSQSTIQSTSPSICSTFMRQASAKYNSEEYLGENRRSQTKSASSLLVDTIQELYSTWVKLQRWTSKIDRDILVTISLGLEHKPQCEDIFLRTEG